MSRSRPWDFVFVPLGLVVLGFCVSVLPHGNPLPAYEIHLVPGVVLELPDHVGLGGPVRIFTGPNGYAVLDVTNLTQVLVFSRDGEFQSIIGPVQSSAGDPARISAIVFHEDGSLRILSGRSQRAFVVEPGLGRQVEAPFPFQSVWDAVAISETELIVNAPSMEPGAVGQPLHRVSVTGEILRSFGRETADLFTPDVSRLRWPIADQAEDDMILAVDPVNHEVWRFAPSGESVGTPMAAPGPLRDLLFEDSGRIGSPSVMPLKSWEETPGRVWSMSWVPESRLGALGTQAEPCPLPHGHSVIQLGAPAPAVTVIDVRTLEEQAEGDFPLKVFECRLVGILAEGHVYVAAVDEVSGKQVVHTFTLAASPLR